MARGRGRGRSIDNLRWIGVNQGTTALAAGSVAFTALSASTMPDTVMRTRGQFSAWIDGPDAPGVSARFGAGLIIVPEGTGTTVLWAPLTDPNAPWFWYTSGLLAYEELVTDVIDSPLMTAYREIVDSKAMRRGPPDTEVQLVIENTTFGGALSFNAGFDGRLLIGS